MSNADEAQVLIVFCSASSIELGEVLYYTLPCMVCTFKYQDMLEKIGRTEFNPAELTPKV